MADFRKIVNRATRKVLDVPRGDPANGVGIIQFGDNGGRNQQWELVKVEGNFHKIVNRATRKVLDVPRGDTSNGIEIIQFVDNGGRNQQWELVKVAGKFHKLVNRATRKVLDVPRGDTANGIKIIQFVDNGGENQQWELLPEGAVVGPPPTRFPLVVSHSNTDNQTKAFANAKISKLPESGLIELNVRVRKNGVSGTGTAYGQVALFDANGNTLFRTGIVEKHKGANANPFGNPGTAEGDVTQTFNFPLNLLGRTTHAAVLAVAQDGSGFPNSIDEMTKNLNKVRDFLKGVSGVLVEVAVIVIIVAALAA